ncbi:MAG TPA: thioesterase family protein [Solirubrobacteraceae bacterium]|jgi:acyl-coenzyme A thioesterase PaaI-like protein
MTEADSAGKDTADTTAARASAPETEQAETEQAESIFTVGDDGSFVPTEHARGPWDPRALHGGAPAALITRAFERIEPGGELRIARLGFELLRPVPSAPLTLSTRVVRAGRRVQELGGELHAGEQLICRASALRVQATPADLPPSASPPHERMPGPGAGEPTRFALDHAERSFATAMEMRFVTEPWRERPTRVWMRLRYPLLPGEIPSPLMRVAATADFGNGVSAVLPFDRYLFINADLTLHLHDEPRGEWIGLEARTLLTGGGPGLAESMVHDERGAVGRAFQTLVVQPR